MRPRSVSLRARFLALFAGLAVILLMAIGILDYVHSTRALENLAAEHVEPISDRSFSGLQERSDRFLARSSANVRTLAPLFPKRE